MLFLEKRVDIWMKLFTRQCLLSHTQFGFLFACTGYYFKMANNGIINWFKGILHFFLGNRLILPLPQS